MKNYLRCPVGPIWLILAVCLTSVASVYSRNTPQPETSGRQGISNPLAAPVFVDPSPNDTIVDCADNVPPPVGLMATDDTDPAFPMIIMPTDSPNPGAIDPCVGATITRTWMAIDMDNDTAIVTQTIVVLPDTEGPEVFDPEIQETLACQVFDYGVWINTQRLRVATNSGDNCSGIDDISDDAPPSFDETCGSLTVTFTLLDNCGNSTLWQAMVNVIDTIAPQMTGAPASITISCSDTIPAIPSVTVTDNCTPGLVPSFQEANSQVMDGTCAQYEYSIVRTWSVSDSCGNNKTHTQVISVDDFTAPAFEVPLDIIIGCDEDPQDLNITGDASNLVDNCDPNPEIFFTDVIQPGNCPGNFVIIRTWRARDVCGNVTGKIQTITVVDDESPDFTVPNDITVNCEDANDDDLTGEPTNISDNCDTASVISFTDVVISGSCVNSYSIRRTWKATDHCGNFTEKDQIITIVDNTAPILSETADNLTLNCTEGIDVQGAFDAWLTNLGGADASDNCTEDPDLVWYAFNSGTTDPASLPINNCPAPGGVIRTRTVDFIVEDECGNRDTTTATFMLLDNQAPVISACPQNTTIATDAGLCEATYTLLPPVIEENCADTTLAITLTGTAPITTSAPPGLEGDTPVNPVFINLNVPIPAPVNALGSGTLTIELVSADAEEATEFFNIYGEGNTFLGTTVLTPAQCGNSTTTITLSASQINNWAQDGIIVISLQPNTTGGLMGRFYINAICSPAGMVNVELDFTAKNFGALVFEYSINQGVRTAVVPIGPRNVSLDPGDHLITYYATDCGGNVDSCSYVITVEDMEAPVSQCPSDIVVNLATGACTASVTLPLPAGASDNCGVYNPFQQTLPADTTSAWLTFNYDPNLNDYIANDELFVFTGVAANAFAPVTLRLDLRGDFVDNNAFLTIYGDDNSVVGVTTPGVSNCSTAAQVSFTIPAATFNTWAADGAVQFRVQPFDVPVPPGLPGDGVNPCNPSVVDANGEVDSVSYVFASLRYNRLTPTYFAQGATTIPPTVMQLPGVLPTHVFNVGETSVFYAITDLAGNADTCSFKVIVEDNEAPTVTCQPAFLFINPSGLDVQTLDVSDIDLGSTDNCTIADRFITPNTFTCAQIGSVVNITLTVVDASGNSGTCNTIAAITAEGPVPTANSGLCGGDTLFLFANPPVGTYTYRWFNPSGMLISTQQNPVILGISSSAEGPYRVEIRGVTNCTAEGVVTVSIEDLPVTPSVLTAASVCSVDDIVLNSSIFPTGNNVVFSWYQGLPPNGTLIGTTSQPTLTIPGPHSIGSNNYYLTVEANGCLSAPSNPVSVASVAKPLASVSFTDTLVCAGTTANLGTPVVGAGIAYQWTGPNGFSSSQQFPQVPLSGVLSALDAGYYYLRTVRSGCFSEPDSTLISIKPKPATPSLASSGAVCEGGTVTLSTTFLGASAYRWVQNGNQSFFTTTPAYIIPGATAANAGSWRLFVTQNGCESDASVPVTVTVNPVPVAAASANPLAVCEGSTLQLFSTPTIAGASYSWSGPNNFADIVQNPVINNISAAAQGPYVVNVTTAAGCSDTATVFVQILSTVSILGVSSNAPACLNGPTTIQLTPVLLPANGNYSYQWTGPSIFISVQPVATIPNATAANYSGNYTLRVTTAQGCPSALFTYVLDISDAPLTPAAPQPLNPGQVSYCEGSPITLVMPAYAGTNVTYYWRGPGNSLTPTTVPMLQIASATQNDSGNYSVFVVVDGCGSQESLPLALVVQPLPTISASSNSPVCSGDVIELSTDITPGAAYVWLGPSSFTSALPNPMIPLANPTIHTGTFKVFKILNGCFSDTLSLEVVVKTRPPAPVAQNNGPICISSANPELTLFVTPGSATAGAFYTWYYQGQPIGAETDAQSFILNNFQNFPGNGTYAFTVKARLEECFSGDSNPTLVTLNTIPANQAFAGFDNTVCNGEIGLLSASQPPIGTGQWTQTGGSTTGVVIVNPDSPTTPVNGMTLSGGPYTFRWTLSNGACQDYSFDETILTISQTEPADAGVATRHVCANSQLNLEAVPPANVGSTGLWSQPPAQAILGVVIVSPTDPNTLITGLAPNNLYVFTWTVTGNCGTGQDEVSVTVSDNAPDAGNTVNACNDEAEASISASLPSLGSTGSWVAINPATTIDDPQNNTTVVRNLQPGENRFVWVIDNSLCNISDTALVLYYPNPIALADLVTTPFGTAVEFDVLLNDQVPPGADISTQSGPSEGTIQLLGNGGMRYTPRPNFVGTDQFTYVVRTTGCIDATATVTIAVGEGAACKAPNIITPNNDGVNDTFVVPCLLDMTAFPNSQVSIFNRWGDEVFRSSIPYRSDWNGTFNGEDLPADTYFYLITLGNGSEPTTGFVVIQR